MKLQDNVRYFGLDLIVSFFDIKLLKLYPYLQFSVLQLYIAEFILKLNLYFMPFTISYVLYKYNHSFSKERSQEINSTANHNIL